MKKLWIFGDSYAVPINQYFQTMPDWHWANLLQQKLNFKDFLIIAANGVSNEWIYYKFKEHLNQIDQEDIVIVIMTQSSRRWFFENNIGASNLTVINDEINSLTPEQKNAVKQYLMYLENPICNVVYFESIFNSFYYLAEKFKLNLLVLPGFEYPLQHFQNLYNTDGSLFNVCMEEVIGKTYENWERFIGIKCKGIDTRVGHLSEVNHKILSIKLFNTFTKNETLDLKNGFAKEIN